MYKPIDQIIGFWCVLMGLHCYKREHKASWMSRMVKQTRSGLHVLNRELKRRGMGTMNINIPFLHLFCISERSGKLLVWCTVVCHCKWNDIRMDLKRKIQLPVAVIGPWCLCLSSLLNMTKNPTRHASTLQKLCYFSFTTVDKKDTFILLLSGKFNYFFVLFVVFMNIEKKIDKYFVILISRLHILHEWKHFSTSKGPSL